MSHVSSMSTARSARELLLVRPILDQVQTGHQLDSESRSREPALLRNPQELQHQELQDQEHQELRLPDQDLLDQDLHEQSPLNL